MTMDDARIRQAVSGALVTLFPAPLAVHHFRVLDALVALVASERSAAARDTWHEAAREIAPDDDLTSMHEGAVRAAWAKRFRSHAVATEAERYAKTKGPA